MQYYYHKLVLAYVHVSIFVIIIDRRQVESHTLHPTEGMRTITLEIVTQFIYSSDVYTGYLFMHMVL